MSAGAEPPEDDDRKSAISEKPPDGLEPYPVGMITRLSHTSVFVLDQDSAKAFYIEKLGFEERFDIVMGEDFEGAGAGFRWLTVGPRDQPDLQIILSSCDMGRSPEAAANCAIWWPGAPWASGS